SAASLLGITDTLFWEYTSDTLSQRRELTERLETVLKDKRPDIVLVPFCIDNHADHRALNKAFARVAPSFSFMVYAYPVWSPLYPNVLIDVKDMWEQKKKALSSYASQLSSRDYVTLCAGLGQYWAEAKGRKGGMLESFFRATSSEYASLVKTLLK
ncbi:MAG TPA: PIG-L family deacetylase, partial [bacterium]|nr:PIG-L family deacetylase [bacterium]